MGVDVDATGLPIVAEGLPSLLGEATGLSVCMLKKSNIVSDRLLFEAAYHDVFCCTRQPSPNIHHYAIDKKI